MKTDTNQTRKCFMNNKRFLDFVRNDKMPSLGRRRCRLFLQYSVDAPTARTTQKNVEKHETVNHRQLALVHVRNQTLRRMHHEKRYRPLTGGDDRGESRQQTKRNEKSANNLHPAADHHQGWKRFAFGGKSAEYLVEPVTGKHQADDQTHDAIKRICKSIKSVHSRSG